MNNPGRHLALPLLSFNYDAIKSQRRAAEPHSQYQGKTGRDWPVCAVKLVDDLAGESPASASFPVGTVVISGDGPGDKTSESPKVNVLLGRMKILSPPT